MGDLGDADFWRLLCAGDLDSASRRLLPRGDLGLAIGMVWDTGFATAKSLPSPRFESPNDCSGAAHVEDLPSGSGLKLGGASWWESSGHVPWL